jgi:hypothetical protein
MSYPVLGVAVTETPGDSTTSDIRFERGGFAVGTRYTDHRGYEYIYVHANGAIDQYDFVVFDEAYEAYALTTALAIDHPSGGVAQVAAADNDYLWLLTRGVGEVNALTSCAAEVQLYSSGTEGHLDDADASQHAIIGIRLSTAVGGGGADSVACYLDNPKCVVAFDGA